MVVEENEMVEEEEKEIVAAQNSLLWLFSHPACHICQDAVTPCAS